MKIVLIGGSGLIGSKLVSKLREQGHEAVAASPNSGVNSVTGEGLAEAMKGASVVVDVSNAQEPARTPQTRSPEFDALVRARVRSSSGTARSPGIHAIFNKMHAVTCGGDPGPFYGNGRRFFAVRGSFFRCSWIAV